MQNVRRTVDKNDLFSTKCEWSKKILWKVLIYGDVTAIAVVVSAEIKNFRRDANEVVSNT